MKTETQTKSKGPGPVRDALDETKSRVYHAVKFCQWVQRARECLDMARGESGPLAQRLRELARSYGQSASGYYATAMGSEVAA